MFDIKIEFDKIQIQSVEKDDLKVIYDWIKVNDDYSQDRYSMEINYEEFYQRFLEYYFSECEFFLKVNKREKLVGIFKGRTEFKNPNEVWLSYLSVDKEFRKSGLGSKVLQRILKYFYNDCGIFNFYAKTNDDKSVNFWIKNDFYVVNDFENTNLQNIILKKQMIKT